MRTLGIVLCSLVLFAGCKKDKGAEPTPAADPGMAKAADPGMAKAPDPGMAKPADPGMAKAPDPVAPPAAGGTNSELENKGLAMVDKMADMFAADAKDCDKLAVDINAFVAANKDLMGQLKDLDAKETPDDKKAFDLRNKDRMEAITKRMSPAMEGCQKNKAVQDAVASLPM